MIARTFALAAVALASGCGAVDPGVPPDLAIPDQAPVDPCQPAGGDFYTPWLPPVGPNLGDCSGAQINQILDVLPSGPTALSEWGGMALNVQCYQCLFVDPTLGTVNGPLVTSAGSSFVDGNSGGCVALLEQDLGPSSCGAHVKAARDCEVSNCASCPVVVAANLVEFNQCMTLASQQACHYRAVLADACVPQVQNGETCLPDFWPTTRDWLYYLVDLFCGGGPAPVVDGGPGD